MLHVKICIGTKRQRCQIKHLIEDFKRIHKHTEITNVHSFETLGLANER